jgi:hypothetical protein
MIDHLKWFTKVICTTGDIDPLFLVPDDLYKRLWKNNYDAAMQKPGLLITHDRTGHSCQICLKKK